MGLRGDGVAADHAAGAVEGNMAVEEPDADVVGHHVCRDHLHVCQRGDVGAHLIDDDGGTVYNLITRGPFADNIFNGLRGEP